LRDARVRRLTDTGATRRLRRRAHGRDLGRRQHHHEFVSLLPSFVRRVLAPVPLGRDRSIDTITDRFVYRSMDIHRSIRSEDIGIDRISIEVLFFPLSFRLLLRMDGWMDRIYLDVVVWVSSM
jgi:hypothetical protein